MRVLRNVLLAMIIALIIFFIGAIIPIIIGLGTFAIIVFIVYAILSSEDHEDGED